MTLDRRQRPPAAPIEPFDFPPFEQARLSNGIELLVATDRRSPLVQIGMVVRGGADLDPIASRGLTSLGAAMLDEGSGDFDAQQIADFVERRGADLVTTGDWDGIYLSVSSLAPHGETLFELLCRIARAPSLPEAEFRRLQAMRLADLANRRKRPSFEAARRAVALTYGDAHPYGDTYLGTEETVAGLTPDDIAEWHRARVAPGSTSLVAAGDVDVDTLAAWAEARLGDWSESDSPPLEPLAAPSGRTRQLSIVDFPEARQTELRLVRPGPTRNDADHLAARVVSLLFGGKFVSRLNLNLRERLGITYGVSSRVAGRRGPGPFTIGCAVDTDAVATAVGEIIAEMDRLREAAPTADEVGDAVSYLLGTFPYRLQSLDGVVDHLEELVLFDLPRDTFDRLPAALAALSVDDVHAVGRRLLDSTDLAIVAAGPQLKLVHQLEAVGTETAGPSAFPEKPAGD